MEHELSLILALNEIVLIFYNIMGLMLNKSVHISKYSLESRMIKGLFEKSQFSFQLFCVTDCVTVAQCLFYVICHTVCIKKKMQLIA